MTPEVNTTAAVWPRNLVVALAALVGVGLITFALGLAGDDPVRAWQIYLVNYLFWSGLAVGGVVLLATWRMASAQWSKPFEGVAAAGAAFFPFAFLLFFPLILAGGRLFPFAIKPLPHRAAWMSAPFVFTRDAVGLLVLLGLAAAYVYYHLRPLVGAREQATPGAAEFLLRGWQGAAAERVRSDRRLSWLAPVLAIVFAIVFSLLSYDLVSALAPHFYSTLFGGYFFFGALYASLAWLAVLSAFVFRADAAGVLQPGYMHPLGKLLFGFCMFHGMLFFSQYLPIWYGNLPHEIEYVVVRTYEGWWPWFSSAFLLASLFVPFVILLSRPLKMQPRWLAGVALLILMGMWLDRFVLVVPSTWHHEGFPFGWLEAGVTAGFAALMLLCYWAFNRWFPLLLYTRAQLPPRRP